MFEQRSILALVLLVLPSLAGSARAEVETYQIDTVHSSVGFKIRHILTPVPGSFAKFSGTITVDRENLENSHVEATIEVASVNTADSRRDDHLRTPDFFAVEHFPAMTFRSTSWTKTGDSTFDVIGDLTIRDVTKPVTLKVTLLGFADAGRRYVSGWEAATRLDRTEWGVGEAGGIVGSEVEVMITIEAVRQ